MTLAIHHAIPAMASIFAAIGLSLSGPAAAQTFNLPQQLVPEALASTANLECVPYARQMSGIEIYGDASQWWDKAAGSYVRGAAPQPGAVLAFPSSAAMPGGHVATVSRVIDSRRILLNHANWSERGRIEQDVEAIDVSPSNDWSAVRVWYGPSAALGSRVNPARGFIYPVRADRRWASNTAKPERTIMARPARTKYAAAIPVSVSAINGTNSGDDPFTLEYRLDTVSR